MIHQRDRRFDIIVEGTFDLAIGIPERRIEQIAPEALGHWTKLQWNEVHVTSLENIQIVLQMDANIDADLNPVPRQDIYHVTLDERNMKRDSKILETRVNNLGFKAKVTKVLGPENLLTFVLSNFCIRIFTQKAWHDMMTKIELRRRRLAPLRVLV